MILYFLNDHKIEMNRLQYTKNRQIELVFFLLPLSMDEINFQDSIFTVLARILIQFFVFLVFSLLFWILWFKFKG